MTAPSLSAASSHKTPAATLWMFNHDCSFLFNHDCSFLVSRQLTQNSSSNSLDVLYLIVEQLDKYRDDGESTDDGSVVSLPGEDVKSPHGSLDNLLHPDPVSVGSRSCSSTSGQSSHPLGVLEGPDQQMHEARNGAILSQRRVIGWTQRQVPDQTNDSLDQRPSTGRM